MKHIMKQVLILFAVASLVALAGCASIANVDYDEKFDFSQLKRFQLQPTPVKSSGDTRIDSPLVEKRITAAIAAELEKKGYQKNEAEADFRVVYQLDVKQEVSGPSTSLSIGVGTFSRHRSVGMAYGFPAGEVETYDRGILTIDILSAASGELIWRGSSSRRLFDGATPEKSDKQAREIVSEILEQFPPEKKP
jgi:hypothetical protein